VHGQTQHDLQPRPVVHPAAQRVVQRQLVVAGAHGQLVERRGLEVDPDAKRDVAAGTSRAEIATKLGETPDEATGEEYEEAFNRAVKKRWPHFGLEIENR